MPLTTSERTTLIAAVTSIPVSDVDVGALQAQLAAANETIAQLNAKIAAGRVGISNAATALAAADQALA